MAGFDEDPAAAVKPVHGFHGKDGVLRIFLSLYEGKAYMMQRRFAQKPKFEGKHADLSEKIIAIFYQVQAELGFGFSEKVYQKALAIALRHSGLKVDEQVPLKVYYRGEVVGEFFADMLINDLILLELKSASAIIPEYEAQLLNYLKATEIEVGYILNFGVSASFKRKIFDNDRKGSLQWTQNKSVRENR